LFNLPSFKGVRKTCGSLSKGWPTFGSSHSSRTTCFPGGQVNGKCALHQLVGRVERALDAGQYALGVFFDIQGALDNTPIVSVLKALSERKIIFAVRQWISTLLQQRKVCVQEGDLLLYVITKCGLPQGGGLSPLLWSLVADSLLKWLSKQGVFTQSFADNGVIIIVGKVLHILSDIMQCILRGVEKWCSDRHLSEMVLR